MSADSQRTPGEKLKTQRGPHCGREGDQERAVRATAPLRQISFSVPQSCSTNRGLVHLNNNKKNLRSNDQPLRGYLWSTSAKIIWKPLRSSIHVLIYHEFHKSQFFYEQLWRFRVLISACYQWEECAHAEAYSNWPSWKSRAYFWLINSSCSIFFAKTVFSYSPMFTSLSVHKIKLMKSEAGVQEKGKVK